MPVRRVDNITRHPSISRDLAMIKVAAIADGRTQVMQLADVYRARIVDVSPEALVIEVTGTEEKVDSLVEMLRPYRIVEMVRTGRVTIARGSGPLRDDRRRDTAVAHTDAVDEASGSV